LVRYRYQPFSRISTGQGRALAEATATVIPVIMILGGMEEIMEGAMVIEEEIMEGAMVIEEEIKCQ
jgi:hypothetical protein